MRTLKPEMTIVEIGPAFEVVDIWLGKRMLNPLKPWWTAYNS